MLKLRRSGVGGRNPVSRLLFYLLAPVLLCAPSFGRAQPAQTLTSPSSSSTPAASVLRPGTLIDASNVSSFTSYLPAAAALAIRQGFKIRIVPTDRLQWSSGFESATEKYSPQVGLDQDDFIKNYVAGMPFPLINVADPKAAAKIAYNWHLGPVLPDDFSLSPCSS